MENCYRPDGMNIELTTRCPLRCPQCYCSLEGGKDIPLDIVIKRLEEAAKLGVKHVELSGGETLCYPYLVEAVNAAKRLGLAPSIAISGWRFSEEVLDRLIEAGIDMICVSLNGPTEKENAKSRDGYAYAINALALLKEKGFQNTLINWVMHRDSVEFFPEMIKLAEEYQVGGILIIDPKPTAKNELDTYPTSEQMRYIAQLVKNTTSSVDLIVQHCFSSLLALCSDNKLWGNTNRGLYKGCTAGLCSYCVDVDGNFTPCRHLEYHEQWDNTESYWKRSEVLKALRKLEREQENQCASCRLCKYCRTCVAVYSKLETKLHRGGDYCPLNGKI